MRLIHFEEGLILFLTSVSLDLLKLDDRLKVDLGRGSNLLILLLQILVYK